MTLRPAPLPTLEDLRRHMDAFGPEGILESAHHLTEDEQSALAVDVKHARKAQRFPKRRRQLAGKGRKR